MSNPPSDDEIAQLAERIAGLRTAITHAQIELKSVRDEERRLSERLARLTSSPDEPTRTSAVRLEERAVRREMWKVGLAGAAAAMLLVLVGLEIHRAMMPAPMAITASPPPVVLAPPAPIAPVPPVPPAPPAPTVESAPPPAPPEETPPRATPVRDDGRTGFITIVCMPKCSEIIDNGVSLGPGHIFNRPVAIGKHEIVLSAPNGVKRRVSITAEPGLTRELRMSMDEARSESANKPASCDPPYWIDAQGVKHYRIECMPSPAAHPTDDRF